VKAIRRVLVANRGEIAVRICRTLREMGLSSVTVFSEADRGAPHARAGDLSLEIGPALASESYLSFDRVLDAARRAEADAIHPGYGFLSENAAFARACRDRGFVFIGPSAECMERLGDKSSARRRAAALGIPVVPGAEEVRNVDGALKEASRVGFPVLLKAAGGGGGRGMRQVAKPDALPEAFEGARREAEAAFRDGRIFLEKLIHPARHVEVQIVGDGRDAVAFGERECSLQRRYQKIVEESSSPAVDPKLRKELEGAAVTLARDAGYSGAGTVEFLLSPDEIFYFLEVNARLQVEHPVTELRYGIDLVRTQIEIASGGKLPRARPPRGHAIEVRLNAEDPYRGFLPQTGTVLLLQWPDGVRVDSGIAEGQAIHAHYDSLLAKVIAHGADREEARRTLATALKALALLGVRTNQGFLLDLLEEPWVRRGETFTDSVESREWTLPREIPDEALLAAAIEAAAPSMSRSQRDDVDRYSPWRRLGGWGRLSSSARVGVAVGGTNA
jgi:acetyl/propionyl-CoA carboxylase alpha subunit